MSDEIERFFDGLDSRSPDPLLRKASGTVRFDIIGDDGEEPRSWRVSFADGEVIVTDDAGEANCAVRAHEELFERVIRGETNLLSAALRGDLDVEGDPELLFQFQRLLMPGERVPAGAGSAER